MFVKKSNIFFIFLIVFLKFMIYTVSDTYGKCVFFVLIKSAWDEMEFTPCLAAPVAPNASWPHSSQDCGIAWTQSSSRSSHHCLDRRRSVGIYLEKGERGNQKKKQGSVGEKHAGEKHATQLL